MKIHILGAHRANAPWAFELKIARALGNLGHEVALTDYREGRVEPQGFYTNIPAMNFWAASIIAQLSNFKPDLILVCRGEGHWPKQLLEAISNFATIALWNCEAMDAPNQLGKFNRNTIVNWMPYADHIFLHQPSGREVGGKLDNFHILPCACVDREWSESMLWQLEGIEKIYDVSFIGTATEYRGKFINRLAELVQPIIINCPDVYGDDMAKAVLQSRINLNIHLGSELNTETRVAEILGLGGFLITEPLSVEGLVKDGTHCIIRKSPKGMAKAIEEMLERPSTKDMLARAGQGRMLATHTFEYRMEEMLAVIGEVK